MVSPAAFETNRKIIICDYKNAFKIAKLKYNTVHIKQRKTQCCCLHRINLIENIKIQKWSRKNKTKKMEQ